MLYISDPPPVYPSQPPPVQSNYPSQPSYNPQSTYAGGGAPVYGAAVPGYGGAGAAPPSTTVIVAVSPCKILSFAS